MKTIGVKSRSKGFIDSRRLGGGDNQTFSDQVNENNQYLKPYSLCTAKTRILSSFFSGQRYLHTSEININNRACGRQTQQARRSFQSTMWGTTSSGGRGTSILGCGMPIVTGDYLLLSSDNGLSTLSWNYWFLVNIGKWARTPNQIDLHDGATFTQGWTDWLCILHIRW